MPHYLDINTVLFTVLGYSMSYLEFAGVLLNLACVILVARKHISTWPIGVVGSVLFIFMFWQIALYSDAILNGYFVVTGFMGWYSWMRKGSKSEPTTGNEFSYSKVSSITDSLLITFGASIGWGIFMRHAHGLMPGVFTQPAAYPMWDGFILIASFMAQWLMMKKRTECWVYWIVVDVASITLYWVKDVKFTSVLYMSFLGLAVYGLRKWHKTQNSIPFEGAH